ncbi:MAG: tetratricopeptide repeat protein [Chloroflexota bacterium]
MRRVRLVDFLHQQVDKRLIIISAAAGYGKTTLLVDFAHDVDLPICWYSLDASDADPKSFFEYLLLSLQQRFPGFGRQTEALLHSVEDVGREINSIVASLTNEIQSDIPDYFLLILDDFHWVDNSEVVNSALDLLIYYLPDNCHLLLSTRTLPQLTFSRLAAQRQVAGLGTTDLRFNSEELARLLRENYKLVMPSQQADELVAASEGWITGILLTTHTLWMGLVENLVKARGADSPLFDYLANEAYLQQPREVQEFLLRSSVLHQMSPELCDRLFAEGTAAEMLGYLVRANLFVVALEGPEEWYRYHNLFQEFLQAKLKAEDPTLYADLHGKAAEMSEEQGAWDWALDHYQAARNTEGAARLVEAVGEEMIRSGRWTTLYRWLDSLPPSCFETMPKLCLFRGRTYLWSGEVERAIAFMERAKARYLAQGGADGAATALTLKSVGLRFKGRVVEALEACQEALGLPIEPAGRAAADVYRDTGICLASLGRLADADGKLHRALEIYDRLGDEPGAATICQSIGILSVQMGNLAKAMMHYQRALSAWQKAGSAAYTAHVLNCIALIHYYTGEYQQALPMLEDALAKVRVGGYLRVEAFVLGSIGDVRRGSGDLRAATEAYETALEIAQRVDELPLVNYLLDALASTHRLLGDYATAERLLRQALQQAEESQSPYEVATYSISAGVLAKEQGDLDRAEQLLRTALSTLEAAGAKRDLARGHLHLASTLFTLNRKEEARQGLERCLDLCRQLGYDAFLTAEGQQMGDMISWALAQGIGGRRLELVAQRLQLPRQLVQVDRRPRIRVESSGPKQIEVYSLGPAMVQVDSRLVTSSDWAVEKTKELFFHLLQQTHPLRKEQIVDDVWPDVEMGKSNSQFHSTMYRLRRALFPQCVTYRDGRYQLTLGNSLWYDAEEFVQLLDGAEQPDLPRRRRIERFGKAIGLYQGPFLDEFYSDWATTRREELEMRYLQALNRLARLRAEEGSLEQAVELLRTAVAKDPFQEESHYGLIHYSALMGDRAAALRHFRSYVELLRDELSAKPSAGVSALAERIASGQSVPSL